MPVAATATAAVGKAGAAAGARDAKCLELLIFFLSFFLPRRAA